MQNKKSFKLNVHSWRSGTHLEYTRQSLADAATTPPTERNFDKWSLKRFSMAWVDLTKTETAFISYSTQVARIYHQNNFALVDARYANYSQTTSKHLSCLSWAAHERGMHYQVVSNIADPVSNENAAYFTALLNEQLSHMRNTRKRPINRLGAYHEFEKIITQVESMANAFGDWSPAGAVMMSSVMRQGHDWRESEEAAVLVARCALDGIFL